MKHDGDYYEDLIADFMEDDKITKSMKHTMERVDKEILYEVDWFNFNNIKAIQKGLVDICVSHTKSNIEVCRLNINIVNSFYEWSVQKGYINYNPMQKFPQLENETLMELWCKDCGCQFLSEEDRKQLKYNLYRTNIKQRFDFILMITLCEYGYDFDLASEISIDTVNFLADDDEELKKEINDYLFVKEGYQYKDKLFKATLEEKSLKEFKTNVKKRFNSIMYQRVKRQVKPKFDWTQILMCSFIDFVYSHCDNDNEFKDCFDYSNRNKVLKVYAEAFFVNPKMYERIHRLKCQCYAYAVNSPYWK